MFKELKNLLSPRLSTTFIISCTVSSSFLTMFVLGPKIGLTEQERLWLRMKVVFSNPSGNFYRKSKATFPLLGIMKTSLLLNRLLEKLFYFFPEQNHLELSWCNKIVLYTNRHSENPAKMSRINETICVHNASSTWSNSIEIEIVIHIKPPEKILYGWNLPTVVIHSSISCTDRRKRSPVILTKWDFTEDTPDIRRML